jgi:hypothetical protein
MVKKILVGLLAAAATIAPAHAVKLYGVTETNQLLSFDSATPGTVSSSVAITGVSGSSILALDIRVRDGQLYALTDDFKIFRVNKASGVASLFANVAITGSNFAFDFNPTNANLRIVSNNDTNYVYNFVTNTLVPGPNVAYGAGPLFGAAKDITGAAYLFNDNNLGTGTTLYVLDSLNDVLSTLNTGTGTLTRVGGLGLDVGARGSFDIVTRGVTNSAFVANSGKLYSANLTTGALSLIGNTSETLFGLTGGVPEPAAWGMMILGFGVVGAAARRRRSARTVTA